ncbi:MAG: peptide ABC transporter substrate-binding protein [Spirochaetales bacterium]|nr:MAG: peptide ABC transporter substrate-binding protein [Spirochaetales bacterium]
MSSEVLLDIRNLTKTFDVKASAFSNKKLKLKAVDNVSLKIRAGETLGLVGESGCGKTTLGRCLLKLYDVDDGRVFLRPDPETRDAVLALDAERRLVEEQAAALEPGRAAKAERKKLQRRISALKAEADSLAAETDILSMEPATLKKNRRHLQMIFQDPWASLNPRMLVKDIISEGPREFGLLPPSEMDNMVSRLLDQAGLPQAAASRYPHEFSGGQRQRIGIARALALNPSLIVCDEPVSALDVSIQAQVLNLLIELQDEYNLTYVFIAHDLSVVQYISDRVTVMYLGRVAEQAPGRKLYETPRHPYTVSLLGSVPVADPDKPLAGTILEGDVPSPVNPPSGCTFHPRCPRAADICSQKIPLLEEMADDHMAACHNPEPVTQG